MNRTWKFSTKHLIAIIVLLVIPIGFIVYMAANNEPSSSTNTNPPVMVKPKALGSIVYPEGWQELSTITKEENDANIISKANHGSPDASVNIRAVEGQLANDFDIKTLPDSVADSLKSEIPDFKLVSKKVTTADKYQAAQINYQQGTDKYAMFIIPRTNRVFYITFKTKITDFDKISQDLNRIVDATAKYISESQL